MHDNMPVQERQDNELKGLTKEIEETIKELGGKERELAVSDSIELHTLGPAIL